jgi:hypothetical protein
VSADRAVTAVSRGPAHTLVLAGGVVRPSDAIPLELPPGPQRPLTPV